MHLNIPDHLKTKYGSIPVFMPNHADITEFQPVDMSTIKPRPARLVVHGSKTFGLANGSKFDYNAACTSSIRRINWTSDEDKITSLQVHYPKKSALAVGSLIKPQELILEDGEVITGIKGTSTIALNVTLIGVK